MIEMPTASEIEAGFAKRLKLVREAKGFSSGREAAKGMGVAENTYTSWERGDKNPRWWHLVLIRRFFGAPLDYLIAGDEAALQAGMLAEIKRLDSEPSDQENV